jgi:hypothetical protein
MKRLCLLTSLLLVVLAFSASVTMAQSKVKRGPDPSTVRDPDLEKESMHNLDVARQYYKLKKAYVAALSRCEEIIAANPTFAHMDEVLFIAGESKLLLSEAKGKQPRRKNEDVAKLRDEARDYLSRVVNEFPESTFKKKAEADLQGLGGLATEQKPSESKP